MDRPLTDDEFRSGMGLCAATGDFEGAMAVFYAHPMSSGVPDDLAAEMVRELVLRGAEYLEIDGHEEREDGGGGP